MKSILGVIKIAVVKILDWDFLIAMLPIIFYGFGFLAYAGDQGLIYFRDNCKDEKDLAGFGFYNMMNSINVFFFMLACCYCIYFALKGRRLFAEFASYRGRNLYIEIAQIVIAVPSIFVVSIVVGFFCIPGER